MVGNSTGVTAVSMHDVEVMMPIVTPYTLPSDPTAAEMLYDIAVQQLSLDSTSQLTDLAETRALCYYIAYLLSQAEQLHGAVASESLGEWSVSYSTTNTSGRNQWYDLYLAIVNQRSRAQLIATGCTADIPDTELQNTHSLDGVGVD